ncbi:MAG: acetyltransferase [Thermoanaerobaculia bacterium]|nr:acetyltransferase [Thermoanaerobaculia bacterium]
MRGVVTITLWALNLVVWGILFLLTILLRFIPDSRPAVTGMLQRIVELWARSHARITDVMVGVEWDVKGLEKLSADRNYLIIANHQSWLDIPIIERFLIRRISFIRFFAKRELIWMPIVGAALWALEMPLVRRYPKELIEKRPELKGRDLATTREVCEHFGLRRSESLLSFMEGTRFTRAKHEAQNPPYRNLLRPKLGGVSLVLAAIGERMDSLLDITIAYPKKGKILWRMANGELDRVTFEVVEREIPYEMTGDGLLEDPERREQFREWIEDIWREKDRKLGAHARGAADGRE